MVQTHGHVQVFGYALLFVMGIALHILPRFKGQAPPSRWLMLATYWTMLAGVFMRASAQPHGQGFVRWMLGASAILELAGIVLFAAIVAAVFWRARDKREPYDRFIGGTAWLVVAGGINGYLTLRAALDGERVLNARATRLLEAAITGSCLFVLGVSYRRCRSSCRCAGVRMAARGGWRDRRRAAVACRRCGPQFGRYG
jgi:hypothetical protein